MHVTITVVVKIPLLQSLPVHIQIILNNQFDVALQIDAGGYGKQLIYWLMMALMVNIDISIARAANKRGCYFTVLHSVTT